MELPDALGATPWTARVTTAIAAVRSAGAALLHLRGTITGAEAHGDQLKTSTDLAAEGWVLGFLAGTFPEDAILAEEQFERAGVPWRGARTYWTVDALDGTRSYVEGYDGFCVQVAFIEDGDPVLGVIAEPVTGAVYVGARGGGAWRIADGAATRLTGPGTARWPESGLRFVDSTRPGGPVGAMFDEVGGQFVECGSVGLKICRVVEGAADIYAKRFTYKLWDVAPGEVLLREIGGALGTWQGQRIDYTGRQSHFTTLLSATAPMFDAIVRRGALIG